MYKSSLFHAATASICLLLSACATSAQFDSSKALGDINDIIYSDLPKEVMLVRLEPYVKVGEKLTTFTQRTGLSPGVCLTGGPGVMDCRPFKGGLNLVVDPDGIVRIIRRTSQTVGSREFNEMSISPGILQWKGYVRGYPN